MTAREQWVCDRCCPDGPEEDGHVVDEDDARDRGWIRIWRLVVRTLVTSSYSVREDGHVCADCQDDGFDAWLADDGWRRSE